MDIVRQNPRRSKKIFSLVSVLVILVVGAAIAILLSSLKPASPRINRSELWMGVVQHGTMLRSVLGHGVLTPTRAFWVSAPNSGQIVKIYQEPGAALEKGTPLFQLDNPDLVMAACTAETQVRLKEADLKALDAKCANDNGLLETSVVNARASYEEAKLVFEYDEELFKQNLISNLKRQRSKAEYKASLTRLESAREQLSLQRAANKVQHESLQVILDQQMNMLELAKSQVEALTVVASEAGILQHIDTELGCEVTRGTRLAYVVCPDKLKAVLKVSETDSGELSLDQHVDLKVSEFALGGHITRIDPVVKEGTVTIDVTFDNTLPAGLKPAQSISGTIEIARLDDVLYVERPALSSSKSVGTLFALTTDESKLTKVSVRYGEVSYRSIEILDGLKTGDKVVLNDMSEWDEFKSLDLN